MACDCIEKLDAQLLRRNTKLSPTLIFGTRSHPGYVTATIQTEVVTKKRGARATAVIPTYCPFCGKSYVGTDVKSEAA